MPEGQVPDGTQGTQGSQNSGNANDGQQQGGNTQQGGQGGGTTPPAQGAGTGGQVPDGQGKEDETFSKEYVKKIRDEAAAARVELKQMRTELAAIKDKDLTESERTAKQLKELQEENAKHAARSHAAEVKAAAVALGCKKPELIARLVDRDVEDVARAVAQIKKETPELFLSSTGSADGGQGQGAGTGAGKSAGENMNFLIRQAAGRV